jgi:soluble lytic murein transglycosylase-like protein
MRELKFTLTFTIRPLRWLRSITLIAMCGLIMLPPRDTSSAADNITQAQLLTPAQVERMAMIDRIEDELRPRMANATGREVHDITVAIVDESREQGVDPLFILALIESESGFDMHAVSAVIDRNGNPKANARGLMQLIPSTARAMGVVNTFDPVDNVRGGIRYVGHLVRSGFGKRGGPSSVLLAYNQGPKRAVDYFRGEIDMPDEAAVFIPRVVGRYQKFLAKFGEDPSRAKRLFRA